MVLTGIMAQKQYLLISTTKKTKFEYSAEINNYEPNINEAEEMGCLNTNPNCNIEIGNNNIQDQELFEKQDANHKILIQF